MLVTIARTKRFSAANVVVLDNSEHDEWVCTFKAIVKIRGLHHLELTSLILALIVMSVGSCGHSDDEAVKNASIDQPTLASPQQQPEPEFIADICTLPGYVAFEPFMGFGYDPLFPARTQGLLAVSNG